MANYRTPMATRPRRDAGAVFPHAITHSRAFLGRRRTTRAAGRRPAELILWADRDIALRTRGRTRWEHLLPHRPSVIVPGAGHHVLSDAPDQFADAINRWHPSSRALSTTQQPQSHR